MTLTNHSPSQDLQAILPLLRCPRTGETLRQVGSELVTDSGHDKYQVDDQHIPLFANEFCSPEALIQQRHYDEIADAYAANLGYPHTLEYMSYLDRVLRDEVDVANLGTIAEVCCGTGEAFALFEESIDEGVGVDVSSSMLHKGRGNFGSERLHFVQGDATRLPLADNSFDTVFMLGGIHHVPDRRELFHQVFRILRPGGTYIWREPVSDFWLWKLLRAIVYRLSPILDHETERPLTWNETVPLLQEAGFELRRWRTCGFFGFCLFMNSDVLFFNRLFRFVPGIQSITRAAARFDDWCTRLPGLRKAGLQVVGVAVKPDKAMQI